MRPGDCHLRLSPDFEPNETTKQRSETSVKPWSVLVHGILAKLTLAAERACCNTRVAIRSDGSQEAEFGAAESKSFLVDPAYCFHSMLMSSQIYNDMPHLSSFFEAKLPSSFSCRSELVATSHLYFAISHPLFS